MRVIPVTSEDAQLHFIVTCRKQGLITAKQANDAIKKLLKDRKEKYGTRYQY